MNHKTIALTFWAKVSLSVFLLFAHNSCGSGADATHNNGLCRGYPGDNSQSKCILPYSSGDSFAIAQGNCTQFTHSGSARYAYDFLMPPEENILAIRAGKVTQVSMSNENGLNNDANIINITHADGTVASYVHLQKDSQTVGVGDGVSQGQVIAQSGYSGLNLSQAHLHLVLYSSANDSLPLTFRNTRSHPQGLQQDEAYQASTFTVRSD